MNYDDDKVRRRTNARDSYDDDMYDDEPREDTRRRRSTAPTYDNRPAQSSRNTYEGRSAQGSRSSYEGRSAQGSHSSYEGRSAQGSHSSYEGRSAQSSRNAYEGRSTQGSRQYASASRRYSDDERRGTSYDDYAARRSYSRVDDDYDDEPVQHRTVRRASENYSHAQTEYARPRNSQSRRGVREEDDYDFAERSRSYGSHSRKPNNTGKYVAIALLAAVLIIAIPLSIRGGLFSGLTASVAGLGTVPTAQTPFEDVFASPTPDPAATEVPAPTEQPTELPTFAPTEVPGRVLDPDKKAIALTFDDGPSKQTRKILATLAEYDGLATFFTVGERLDDYSETLQMIYDSGCQIGMHTYSHANLRKLSKSEILDEINKTNDLIYKYTGEYSHLVRPPYGAVNDTVKATVEQPMINWSIDTRDWESRDADSVYNAIMSSVQDGDIILMHDLYSSTAEAVSRVVPELVAQGYQLCTVDELFKLKGIELTAGKVYLSAKKSSDD